MQQFTELAYSCELKNCGILGQLIHNGSTQKHFIVYITDPYGRGLFKKRDWDIYIFTSLMLIHGKCNVGWQSIQIYFLS
jgi:hypothetical protein